MTPSEVQRIELALRGLAAEVAALADKFDTEAGESKVTRDDVESLKLWRSRAQGAAWAFGLMWLVATFGIGVALALLA